MFRSLVFASLILAVANPTLAESSSKTTTAATGHTHAPPKQVTSLDALKNRPKTTLKVAKTDMVMHVGDLHCAHCAKNLTSKLYTVKGVKAVRADIKADVAVITPQSKKKVDPKALWAAAKKSGFPAIKLVSPSGTYVLDAKTKQPMLMPAKAVPKT